MDRKMKWKEARERIDSLCKFYFPDMMNSTAIAATHGKENYSGWCTDFWDEGPKQQPGFLLLLELFTALWELIQIKKCSCPWQWDSQRLLLVGISENSSDILISSFFHSVWNSYNENTNMGKLRRNCHKTQSIGTIYFVQGNKDGQHATRP